MAKLFVFLLIAHVFGDFIIQNHTMCDGKFKEGIAGIHLYIHSVIIFYLSLIAIMYLEYWYVALIIAVTHFIIDGLKSKVEKIEINGCEIHDSGNELYTFVADQILHIIVIYFCACWLNHLGWKEPLFLSALNLKTLVFILMFYVCGKPANILTRRVLIKLNIIKRNPKVENDPKTGSIIGLVERRLIIFFMFVNQFAAIGFLITAKSILRFSDIKQSEDNKSDAISTNKYIADRSEYVLIGTFVSISIAATCGFIIMIAGNPSMLSADNIIDTISASNYIIGH